MIIDLTQSKLFTDDPDTRFAKEYGVPKGTWTELWKRYKLMDYSNSDLRDYLFIKYARSPGFDSIQRWIWRTEVYSLAKPKIDKGVQCVTSSFFGDYEQRVMNELTKQLRYGASRDSKSLI